MKITLKRERMRNFIATKIGDTAFNQIQEMAKKYDTTKSEVVRTAIVIGLKKLARMKKCRNHH